MATRAARTAYSRGESDGRGAAVIDPPIDAVNKASEPAPSDSSDTAFVQRVPVVKSSNDAGDFLLFGVVMRPDAVDAHGEFADAKLVRKSSHDFLAGYGTANGMGVQHQEFDHPIELVESAIETVDHEKHGLQVLAGDWTVTARVNSDALKEQVTKSALTGFSIGGFGAKTTIIENDQPVAKSLDGGGMRQAVAKFTRLAVHEISLVDSPANEITFVIAKRRSKEDEMKSKTEDQAAELAAAQAQAQALQEKLDAANAELAKVASKPASEPADEAKPSDVKPSETPAPQVPSADAQEPAPVSKAKRFTKGRAAALKTLQEQQAANAAALATLIADIDGETVSDDAASDSPAETVVITKAVPTADIEAAVAKAMQPTIDEIAVLKKKLDEANSKLEAANIEIEVVKGARLPATSRQGESITKQRDRVDLWGNLI